MSRFSASALAGLLLGSLLVGAQPSEAAPISVAAQNPRDASGIQANSTQVFRSLGLIGNGASVLRTRTLPPASSQSTAGSQNFKAAATSTTLSFDFSHYSSNSGQRDVLRNFLSTNYGLLVAFYGVPAPEQGGKTVTVVGDSDFAAAYQPLLKPSATDGGTIYYRYVTLDRRFYSEAEEQKLNQFNIARLALRAFHGPNTFSYDYAQGNYIEAWQGGFADAAALLVANSLAGSPSNFDPSLLGSYVLPVYDFLNRPELGNAYVYTRSGADLAMSDFRAAMAQAAFLKIAVENPTFFKQFNALYYARFTPRQNVNPNSLRALAAEVVPTVEGTSFFDWVRRQYVLDTSVTQGQKIYAAVLPLPVTTTGDTRPRYLGFAQAFVTDSAGDETPSTGYGSINAFDEKGNNINAFSKEIQGGNPLSFNDANAPGQASFGAGFSNFGTPNQARVTLKIRFKAAETSAYFPFIAGNGVASKLTYYGVTTTGVSGTLALKSDSGVSESLPVTRGTFSGVKTYVSKAAVKTTLTIAGKTFVRNLAWLAPGANARGAGFVLEGGVPATTFNFTTAAGSSPIRMISLPFYPQESDEAKIFGIAPDSLKLARYRPNLAPGTLQGGVLKFGIDGQRHELYPYISTPMAPGRGYWLGINGAFSKTIPGSEPPRDKPFEVALPGGWNQIGVPFNRAFAPTALKVRYGGFAPVSYNQAVSNGWIRPGIWRWQPRGGYAIVDSTQNETLVPFEGYYLYVVPQTGVSLVFDPAATATALTAASGWSVPLIASTRLSRDASNSFGVTDRAAAAKPPAAAPVATLRFLSSGDAEMDASGAGAASGWADSFLASLEREASWDFVVEGVAKGERTYLSWGDLAQVPTDINLTLTDKKTGGQMALRPGGSYAWNSDGGVRAFTLRARRLARPQLTTVVSLSRTVAVEVALNVAAPGRLEIRNPAGDTVATLRSGQFPLGTSKFTWSGKMTSGQMAPVGRYRAIWLPLTQGDGSAASGFTWP